MFNADPQPAGYQERRGADGAAVVDRDVRAMRLTSCAAWGCVRRRHAEAVKRPYMRAIRRAGIEDLRFHNLRHEATTRLFEKVLNLMEVASITGHKDLRMLRRFTHLKAENLARKLGRLASIPSYGVGGGPERSAAPALLSYCHHLTGVELPRG